MENLSDKDNQQVILLVDDSKVALSILDDILANAGFRTHLIESASEVSPAVAVHRPSLIVMPAWMPNASGLDTLVALRNNSETAELPIIITLTHDALEESLKAFEIGATDCIFKPFRATEVLTRVKAAIHPKRCQCTLAQKTEEAVESADKDTYAVEVEIFEAIRTQLSACVSIELSGPLNGLVQYADRCAKKEVNSDTKAAFELFNSFLGSMRRILSSVGSIESLSKRPTQASLENHMRIDLPTPLLRPPHMKINVSGERLKL